MVRLVPLRSQCACSWRPFEHRKKVESNSVSPEGGVARGRQRIRQRGSRQQWAAARNYKAFGGDELDGTQTGTIDAEAEANGPPRPLTGADVVASTRCELCNVVVEQRLRDGRKVVLVPYALCMSCDGVRCEACWAADDDFCEDDVEHEFLEVHYDDGGRPAVADFATWA